MSDDEEVASDEHARYRSWFLQRPNQLGTELTQNGGLIWGDIDPIFWTMAASTSSLEAELTLVGATPEADAKMSLSALLEPNRRLLVVLIRHFGWLPWRDHVTQVDYLLARTHTHRHTHTHWHTHTHIHTYTQTLTLVTRTYSIIHLNPRKHRHHLHQLCFAFIHPIAARGSRSTRRRARVCADRLFRQRWWRSQMDSTSGSRVPDGRRSGKTTLLRSLRPAVWLLLFRVWLVLH